MNCSKYEYAHAHERNHTKHLPFVIRAKSLSAMTKEAPKRICAVVAATPVPIVTFVHVHASGRVFNFSEANIAVAIVTKTARQINQSTKFE